MITRFAPSPTGHLHLGHAASALFAAAHGNMILRIEDIDQGRCRPHFIEDIYTDLRWIGLDWPQPVRKQSEHFDTYREAIEKLDRLCVLYPCFCSRKQIEEEIALSPSAPHGPEGALYPGSCKHLSPQERAERVGRGETYALRLDVDRALTLTGPLHWHDRARGMQAATPELLGDVVLARKDVPASYHLCVTIDDDIQGIGLVTRGEDLFHATHIHRLLQALLELKVPDYHHHGLLLDTEGKRFAKRNHSVTLQHLREVERLSPGDVRSLARLPRLP